MPTDQKDLQALKEELSKLKELQKDVTKLAVFGGLSEAEAEQYDERQQRIMKIVAALEERSVKS